jgi:hypothetical protein
MKRWLPFLLSLAGGLAAAAGFHFFHQRSQLAAFTAPSSTPASQANQSRSLPPGGRKAKAKSETEAKLEAATEPTRNGMRRLFARSKAIFSLSREETEALLEDLEKNGRISSPLDATTLMAAYARLAEFDPQAAMERAGSQKRQTRDIGAFAVMSEWLVKDRTAAVSWFQTLPDNEDKQRFLQVLNFAGSSDPTLSAELTGSIADPEKRAQAVRDSIRSMAWSNPELAMKRLGEIEDPDQRAEAERDVLRGLAVREPERAVATAFSKPDGDPSRTGAVDLVRQWSDQDGPAALKWIASQPPEVQAEILAKDKGLKRGFAGASADEVKSAALKVNDSTQRDRLHAAWINAQAGSNPEAGFTHLANIKDRETQSLSAANLAAEAARKDNPEAVELWLSSNPPAPVQSAALARYAETVGRNDPIAGKEWAQRIPDPKVRADIEAKLANPK